MSLTSGLRSGLLYPFCAILSGFGGSTVKFFLLPSHRTISLLFLFSILVASCSAPRGWVVLEDPPEVEWEDDASQQSLERAVEQSIVYFNRLPTDRRIAYGKLHYTPEEMVRSLRLFLQLRKDVTDPEQFREELWKRFHIFESVSEESENLFTGYYEPIIRGSLKPKGRLQTPLYNRPDNLVEIDLSDFGDNLPDQRLVGRVEQGRVLPFFSREEIQEDKKLKGKVKPIAYVNEVDLFFLQIQGSGIVHMTDGKEIRVGYHGHNGHPYRSIGAKLIRQEAIPREDVTMQTIRTYLDENPDKVRSLLFSNPSYVFFRPLDGEEGPLGNISVPLTPGRSLALDRRLFPKGGLVYLSATAPLFGDSDGSRTLNRFMLTQDTGGAIRGHGRGDVFWGKGLLAEWNAGHMKHPGRMWLIVARKEYLSGVEE